MPSRPVAQRVWNGSTSTGNSTANGFFGDGKRFLSAWVTQTSTGDFTYTAQVTAGGSTHWETVITVSSTNTVDAVQTSTGPVFDKARINVTANATTGGTQVWLAAY